MSILFYMNHNFKIIIPIIIILKNEVIKLSANIPTFLDNNV